VTVRQGEISAGAVVVAAGPWTRDFLQRDGLALPLQPQHHDAVLLDCPPEASPRTSILDLIHQVYARPETGGLTVAGSLDMAVGYGDIEADDECPAPPLDYGLWVWERLVRRYPGMQRGSLRRGWSGPTIVSPDGQPLLGPLPLKALYCATGFSGAGLKIAPAVGDLLAGLVAGEAHAAQALHPFRPSRFAEGQPFVAQYSWGTIA
jgi:sarcosine oxidase subunit beta